MSAATALLQQHLHQLRDRGVTHILMRPAAMDAVRHLDETPHADSALEPQREARVVEQPSTKKRDGDLIDVSGNSREEKLAALRTLAETWEPARSLGSLRQTMVFAVGNPQARLMLVGEAPGAEEEKLCEPFVGPAGQKLTAILKAMGLARSEVYISNICKFRPAMDNQGRGNRKPTAEEMRACLPFVLTEIDIIRPEVIVALGATAAEGLGIPGAVGSLRGRFHTTRNIPTMVTYHPSYLLREEQTGDGIRAKRMVWEDMLKVMEQLGMPVTDKQRGFFKAKP
ncbi:MAG: uracil-DNA glycosylase [Prosthecobacter sp.]